MPPATARELAVEISTTLHLQAFTFKLIFKIKGRRE